MDSCNDTAIPENASTAIYKDDAVGSKPEHQNNDSGIMMNCSTGSISSLDSVEEIEKDISCFSFADQEKLPENI